MYSCVFMGWFPHYLYLKGLSRKINRIYLMRGGKYARVEVTEYNGEKIDVWITISELHLLNKDLNAYNSDYKFLDTSGQLLHDIGVEVEFFNYFSGPLNNEMIYFMKSGTVYQPELFEKVIQGYNIDDTDFAINTEDNMRLFEPENNY